MRPRAFANSPLFALLAVVLLTWPALLAAQATKPAPPQNPRGAYRISGTVVNAKTSQPLARAQVAVTNTKNSKDNQSMTTADDGKFQFQVGSGKYSLQGAKRGFLTHAYEQHENFWTGIVAGSGLDTETLVLRLPPVGMIAGKVTDEVGDPARGATVTVFYENHVAGIARIVQLRSVATDDLGTYEATLLPAGTYFVSASAQPWYAQHPPSQQPGVHAVADVDRNLDVAYPVSYYKDAGQADDATPIPVRPGDHAEVDFQLAPTSALRLVLHAAADASGAFNMPAVQQPTFGGFTAPVPMQADQPSPGVYELSGLPPGRYSLESHGSSDGNTKGSTDFELANDGQEMDLSAGPPAATVKMTAQLQGATQLPPRLSLGLRDEKGNIGQFVEVNEKGEAELPGVLPGEYDVVAGGGQTAYSVSRITSEEVTSKGHRLSVAAGATLPVSVTLVSGTATVEGFAQRLGKPAAAAMIVLVPNDPESNPELFRRDQSDLDGSFALRGIVPGTYTVLAIEDGWELDWAKPAVIEIYRKRGQKLIVPDRMKGSLHLPGPVEVQPRL